MNNVFNFQENESYNLHTHLGTVTESSLGSKLWKLIPDKIKHASALSAFKANIKFWTINNCTCRL